MKTHPSGSASLLAKAFHARVEKPFTYRGMCDASAAAPLGPDCFVAANDERNQLKVYQRGKRDPVDVIDLSEFLGTKKDKESDLEGTATVGERIYWISSHGRNKKGKFQGRRHRFFATDIVDGTVKPVGQPYRELLADMLATEHLQHYDLAGASSKTPEADGAFNIEGLAATPQGTLLIGLRNPVPHGMALVIPLLNPDDVIEGEHAQFGQAIELDLEGLAVRSLEQLNGSYLVVAGPPADEGSFALFTWTGEPADKPVLLLREELADVRPEALFAIPETNRLQILSDDGGEHVKSTAEDKQEFRSVTITLTDKALQPQG
ncbi:DUF3616 domain-containing protein [Massilia sp. PAMC28688]|uniref:DUF3616 domain-containing protein n=1 Tax=Massilia sp. PAMC28688 TaxID=2861283 RepID=UPI001C62B5B2|nr:DUF3616 domain-containing protein [Massilia sp. PAMC28688]QYF92063.1 DUF3616 domain-containing protein [Massilia sp. PAMC28688]